MGKTKWIGVGVAVIAITAFVVGFAGIGKGLQSSFISKPHELVAVSHNCLAKYFPNYKPIDPNKQDFDTRSPEPNTMDIYCGHATSNKLPEFITLNVPEELRTSSGTEQMQGKLVDLYEYSDGQIEIVVTDDTTGKRYTTSKYHD